MMIVTKNISSELEALGYQLPESYHSVFERELVNILPWRFLTEAEAKAMYEGLKQLGTTPHHLLPFARRIDNDDVACFVVQSDEYLPNMVIITHLYAAPEFDNEAVLQGFWEWFTLAIQEMIEHLEGIRA